MASDAHSSTATARFGPGSPGRRRLQKPLVLVGLMGSGKSTVGRRLAVHLGMPFVDADTEIEAAAGMTIAEIFDRYGEPTFRDGERRVIARLIEGVWRAVSETRAPPRRAADTISSAYNAASARTTTVPRAASR